MRMGVRFRWLVSVWLVAASLGAQADAANLARAGIPFQFREGLIRVQVRVPQTAEPLNFILDTGAEVSVIGLQTMRRLGLKSGKRVAVRAVQSTTEGFWPVPIHATAGGVRLPMNFLALDLVSLSRACEIPVDGLIGADFFRGRIVQIDFEEEIVKPLKSYKPSVVEEVIPLQTRSGSLCASIVVDGGAAEWARLDTGCAAALQWVTSRPPPESCSRKMAIGLAAVSIPMSSASVRLGTLTFVDVPVGIHTQSLFPGESGLLGNGLLSRFRRVTVDSKAGRLLLQK